MGGWPGGVRDAGGWGRGRQGCAAGRSCGGASGAASRASLAPPSTGTARPWGAPSSSEGAGAHPRLAALPHLCAGFGVHEAIQAVAARARELVAGAAQASRHLALRAAVADGVCHMSSSAEARPWRSVGLGMCPSAEPQGFVGRMQGAPREGGGQQLAGHLSAAAVHKAKGGLALRARAVCTARALHAALGALQGSGRTGPPLSWCGTPEHGGPAMQQACLAMPGSTALPACTAVQA
jgi:hypothetical protein